MRILHTSDWHLGVSLDHAPREEEHERFLSWLLEETERTQAEVLLHTGDVFDDAQPAARSQRLYYDFLARASRIPSLKKIVVVGGNHDSPTRLDAPEELLRSMDVHIVGGLLSASDEATARCLCPITTPDGHVSAVILAVPYIHESRLGFMQTGLNAVALREDLTQRFRAFYARLTERAMKQWPGVPIIATGHLTCYAQSRTAIEGADQASSYPLPIHLLESMGSLPPTIFSPVHAYVALGHIHKQLPIEGVNAWYPGSPVPTDAVEASYARYNLLVDVDPEHPEAHAKVEPREVPLWRQNHIIQGSMESVLAQIDALRPADAGDEPAPLPPYLYVDVVEEEHVDDGERKIRDLIKAWPSGQRPKLVRHRELNSGSLPVNLSVEATQLPPLELLSPREVFRRLYQLQHRAEAPEEILLAFDELVSAQEVEP
jgi:DNA repair protein SbcD/Mre11